MSAALPGVKPWPYRRLYPEARVFLAGHRGLVGSAILRRLEARGYRDVIVRSSSALDLRRQRDVEQFFVQQRPEFVILAAARVGGIHANSTFRAEFIRDNLLIQDHVIDAAHRAGVQRLLFLGSSCIYPRAAEQPIREEALLSGPLELTNEPYAVAKIAGLKLCEAMNAQYGTRYLGVMPTNLYGPRDNFDLESAHVLPAILRRIHEAKLAGDASVKIWGSGKPRREFLHADDCAEACIFLLEQTDETTLLNIGAGEDLTIYELAQLVCEVVGYEGELTLDTSRPDGTPRKLLDSGRLRGLGWRPRVGLREGLAEVYRWYLEYGEEGVRADASRPPDERASSREAGAR